MDNYRVLFLIIGVVIVVVVGRLLALRGRRFLSDAAPATRASAGPAATLVAVLFHLLTLGFVALLAVVPVGQPGEQGLLVRLGVLLIILAVIYGIALAQLGRRRREAIIADLETRDTDAPRTGEPRLNNLAPGMSIGPVRPWSPRTAEPAEPAARTATGDPRLDP